MANSPQRTTWNSTPELIPSYVQLANLRVNSKLWVELADCTGASGEVILADDVSNATIATCKTRT